MKKILLLVLLSVTLGLVIACSDTINYENTNNGEDVLFIYPNPTSHQLDVRFVILWGNNEVSLFVLDIYGRIVVEPFENQILSVGEHQYTIQSDLLPIGTYTCILDINGNKYIEDFTVVR